MDDLIEALTILRKYLTGYAVKFPTHCEHDILLVVAPRHVSEGDANRLSELGFHWSGEYECWASFRFGSC